MIETKSQNLNDELRGYGQIVLVLQSGGALGAYQGGVYQALHEAGIEPDWVIGTSIGAINAGLIAGNAPENRLEALTTFWRRVENRNLLDTMQEAWAKFEFTQGSWYNPFRTMSAVFGGVPNFYAPKPAAFASPHIPFGPEDVSYYSTGPLRRNLSEMIDFDRINTGSMRMTVGAASVRTGEMHYFDTHASALSLDHVMASGALPPAFPAVRIDGELYWDGGIVSNTPVEAVFDDEPRQNSVVFAVHLWNPDGEEPKTIWQVMNRQKDIQYASRATSNIRRQRQLHRLRHVIQQMSDKIGPDSPFAADVEALKAYGCETRIHVLRLMAPKLSHEDHTKDVDFSPAGIKQRWAAGYENTRATLELGQWRDPVPPLEGFVLHETMDGEAVSTPAAIG
jgi:NTE family protein